MYATGFFLLGDVTVNLSGSGEYSYDCCNKKPLSYNIHIDASFSDNFDEIVNFSEPGWGDTGITFTGSWTEQFNGSFSK
jgi:hypothetical protein